MNILHTSDWHLGRALYGRKRDQEFEAFLAWLSETIQQTDIDALLVAGDVFDTTAPSHRAQQIYYQFLCRVATSCCRHVVIIAGNHDSPSFLNAPKELLKALNVHVVGNRGACPEEEVLVLRNDQNDPELIVCAVPYLRDRDIRVAEAGESIADKEQKLIDGIRAHYAAVVAVAEQQREALGGNIPIVAMGHLFTAGGQTLDGDGVRDLYVGSLARVTAEIFPQSIDYLALGHLHVPQKVNNAETRRYSGSPLPMGFGEAKQQKSLCQVTLTPSSPGKGIATSVQLIAVPLFQQLECIKGDWDQITKRLGELSATHSRKEQSIWLEVIYDGHEIISDLRERLETATAGTALEILRMKNNRVLEQCLGQIHEEETLADLSINEVFERCLAAHGVAENQRTELLHTYLEAVSSLHEDDARAQ